MGALGRGDDRIELRTKTLFGRTAVSDVRLFEPGVSGHHAEISWTENGWLIRDLNSQNGTFLNGQRLQRGTEMQLVQGASIRFDGAPSWRVLSVDPPEARAESSDGRITTGSSTCLHVGDEDEDPILFVDGVAWLVQHGDREPTAVSGPTVTTADGCLWTLDLPAPWATTLELEVPTYQSVEFRFVEDERGLRLEVWHAGRKLMSSARAYVSLMMELAREWDQDGGPIAAGRGWVGVSTLQARLGVTPAALRLYVHRARRDLQDAGGIVHGARAIGRRKHPRQLRFGGQRVLFFTRSRK